MTVLGFLADAVILSGGIVSFWLLDREVRPQPSARPAPDGRVAAPPAHADIAANDAGPLEADAAPDRGPATGARVISLTLYDRARRPVGSA